MNDNFNQNDFEEFLQNKLRNQRMYPGDRVWKNIKNKLHRPSRWPALTIAAIIILSATILICAYFAPKPNLFAIKPVTDLKNITHTSTPANLTDKKITSTSSKEGNNNSSLVKVSTLQHNQKATKTAKKSFVPSTQSPLAQITEMNLNRPVSIVPSLAYINSNPISNNLTSEKVGIGRQPETSPLLLMNDAQTKNVDLIKENSSEQKSNQESFNEGKVQNKNLSIIRRRTRRNRFGYLLYIAPSISYRNLLEDKAMLKSNAGGPVAVNYVTDVNNVVRHKPGTGIEAGVSLMYNYTNKVRFKSGLQFNVRQYTIEAYRSSTELASIALMENNRVDTVNTISYYRNTNGLSSAQLTNRYYQLSLPIGIEWEVFGNRRIQFNIAGSIQPTYLLNHNAYLLSTNFKNYTEDPGMVRNWNINSNIEASVSFQVGDFKWQVGPQLRYQPYSTFISQYPIKEHLMDYGIKLGVFKMIK